MYNAIEKNKTMIAEMIFMAVIIFSAYYAGKHEERGKMYGKIQYRRQLLNEKREQ